MSYKYRPPFMMWMAWRQIASRSRHGLSFMTSISIAGVAVGVAALVIVLSVMAGFERDLKARMLEGQPHLEIYAEQSLAGFSSLQYSKEFFAKAFPEATHVELFSQADVVIKHGKHLASGLLFGIEPQGGELWGYKQSMLEGNLADIGTDHRTLLNFEDSPMQWPGLVLGDKLARQLGVSVGDELAVLSPSAMLSSSAAMAGQTISRAYVVVGIFSTGLFNYDAKWAIVRLAEGRKFLQGYDPSLDEDEYVSGVGLNLKDPFEVGELGDRVQKWSGLQAKSWQQVNASMILALKLEKFTMGSILMLIVLVAAFSISGTMMMSVFHKKRQVCLLRAVGMDRRSISWLFLAQGLGIASIGIIIGMSFGLGVCWILLALQGTSLSDTFGFIQVFPVRFLPFEYGVITLFAWLLSFIGAFYPAWIAAKEEPSQGLRY